MSDTPVAIFSARIDPAGVLDVLRTQGATVLVDANGRDWTTGSATWKGGLLKGKRVMKLNHHPDYYSDQSFEKQLPGMTGFVLRYPVSEPLLAAIRSFRFAVSMVPGAFEPDDPRWTAVLAVAAHLDGIVVTPWGFLDRHGRELVATDGREPDPAAVAPAFAEPNPVLTAKGPLYQRDAVTNREPPPHRARSVEVLTGAGFAAPWWLPGREPALRPPEEIARRLLALNGLFAWVTASDANVAEALAYLNQDGLRSALSEEETSLLGDSRASLVGAIGWKLENMWPLAWALGHEPAPPVIAGMIDDAQIRALLGFLNGLRGSVAELLSRAAPRSLTEVTAMEDLFYCAHHAVRSAQTGRATVPRGFHPVSDGGVIHERRHALTWMVSPGVAWDETDLAT